MEARPYQQAVLGAVTQGWREFRKQLVVMPTGSGKTCVFSWLAQAEQPGRTLILAHRDELVDQAIDKLNKATGIFAQKEKAEFSASLEAPVVVASIQTMRRRLEQWPADHFSLVVADEAHHCVSDEWQAVLKHFDARVLGVTASPDRMDKKNLGRFFENIACEVPLFDLIHQGYLSRILIKAIPIKIDLAQVKSVAGDYESRGLGDALTPYLTEIAQAIKREAAGRRILSFLPLRATSRTFADICQSIGINARHVDGDSPDRKQIREDFANDKIELVSNAMLWAEGFDDPGIDCIAPLRPTRSRALFSQMVGRGSRIAPMKENCIAEGSLVLTDHGEIQIEHVKPHMKVWDGCQFVSHGGVIFKGKQQTITYAGLTATPEHLCWTKKGWKSFKECKDRNIPIAVSAKGGNPIREIEGLFRVTEKKERRLSNADAMPELRNYFMERSRIGFTENGGVSRLCKTSNRPTMALGQIKCSKTTLHKSSRPKLSALRRQRHQISFRFPNESRTLGNENIGVKTGTPTGPYQQQRALPAWQYQMVKPDTATCEYKTFKTLSQNSSIEVEAPRSEICGSDSFQNVQHRHDYGTNLRKVENPINQTKRRVWDILNCGPLHRFTVEGLLVHNCLLLDFLWLSQKHNLVRPAHLVASSEEMAETITQLSFESGGSEDLEGLASTAQQKREEKLRRELEAKSRKQAFSADAMEFCLNVGNLAAAEWEDCMEWHSRPASEKQLALIQGAGIAPDSIRSRGHASAVIDLIQSRRKLKLATPKQVKMLIKFQHAAPHAATFEQASAFISSKLRRYSREAA